MAAASGCQPTAANERLKIADRPNAAVGGVRRSPGTSTGTLALTEFVGAREPHAVVPRGSVDAGAGTYPERRQRRPFQRALENSTGTGPTGRLPAAQLGVRYRTSCVLGPEVRGGQCERLDDATFTDRRHRVDELPARRCDAQVHRLRRVSTAHRATTTMRHPGSAQGCHWQPPPARHVPDRTESRQAS